uniref:NADH-ubiquinone oxidoreductase chain 6 n=1 Tax=Omophoita sp. REN-2018 TaxID=2506509 RepID=A0A411D9Y7_9CUCU|nr:NADH dehydrogenase subunit 6 [Omophoita sp. REN-2018]
MSDMILMMMMINASLFIFLNHPLSCGLILLIQVILTSLITGLISTFWYSYILFLIMIGGMLILFIYMTSIASNEKFKLNNKLIISLLILMTLMTIIFMIDKYYMNIINNIQDMTFFYSNSNFKFSLNKYFNKNNNILMIMMMTYLLITLILVVKITNFKYGSLRQKF